MCKGRIYTLKDNINFKVVNITPPLPFLTSVLITKTLLSVKNWKKGKKKKIENIPLSFDKNQINFDIYFLFCSIYIPVEICFG